MPSVSPELLTEVLRPSALQGPLQEPSTTKWQSQGSNPGIGFGSLCLEALGLTPFYR